jgi:hypothetical protein
LLAKVESSGIANSHPSHLKALERGHRKLNVPQAFLCKTLNPKQIIDWKMIRQGGGLPATFHRPDAAEFMVLIVSSFINFSEFERCYSCIEKDSSQEAYSLSQSTSEFADVHSPRNSLYDSSLCLSSYSW